MSQYVVKLPDVGEGVAEAELVKWFVEVGDVVSEEARLAEVVTDKVSIELPSPVAGTVLALHGNPGDLLAVGSELVVLATDSQVPTAVAADVPESPDQPDAPDEPSAPVLLDDAVPGQAVREEAVPTRLPPEVAVDLSTAGEFIAPKPQSTPPVRRRAKEAGVDLADVSGTGPDGRITHADLTRYMDGQDKVGGSGVLEIPMVGIRRKIAQQMTTAKTRIPHITYVEEVDVTDLLALRDELNQDSSRSRLSILPFLMVAVARSVREYPRLNSRYDDVNEVIEQHASVDIGIATQTDSGLVVPVVRGVQERDLWGAAAEMQRVTEAAKAGRAIPADMGGSTITITSLGALGGLVTTPVINYPEVAIVGVNKIQKQPVWDGNQFVPRDVMNLSSAFDHRVVDGYDAAVFIQHVKKLLEMPALLFVG